MRFEDVIQLNSRVTLQQMLHRQDFRERLDKQQAIGVHEIQYPIMQGWDSVKVRADVELGATDQLLNILVGRDLQKEERMPQQVAFLLPILEGLDGSQKMSKSLGNYVALTDPPSDMFGKIMSITDQLMEKYYVLLLGRAVDRDAHPLEAKKRLAFEIVQTYHGSAAADTVLEDWNARFSERRLRDADLPALSARTCDAVSLVVAAYAEAFSQTRSRTDARRLIDQGSVQLNSEKLRDAKANVAVTPGDILRLDKTHAVRVS